jgi:hypothetical protein
VADHTQAELNLLTYELQKNKMQLTMVLNLNTLSTAKVLIFILAASLFLGGVGCHSMPRSTNAELQAKHPEWPSTVNDAVTRLLSELSEKDKEAIKVTKRDDLIKYHFNLGLWIRNNFGLWNGNYSLLTDCHSKHPDGASGVIIEALWQKLQTR